MTACVVTMAQAQSARGIVVDSLSGAPVPGAIVTLLAIDTTRSPRSTLTDESGRFVIAATREGYYAIEVKRIGVKRLRTPPAMFGRGETRKFTIRVGAIAAELAGVVTAETRRCAMRREDGSAAAAIWEEVRAALLATELSVNEARFSVTLQDYERDLDPVSGRVLAEHNTERRGVTRNPYVSAAADELSEDGYIVTGADGVRRYRAPDASVLISDAFIRDHCFHLASGVGRTATSIGLAFEPRPERRQPDIGGTLWVDRTTRELRYLEFAYMHVPEPHADEEVVTGGRVEFKRLPSGAWIVQRWHVRAPVLELAASPRSQLGRQLEPARIRTVAIREVGGAVVADEVGLRARDSSSTISGIAFDSTSGAPLVNALVTMVGTSHETRSGADGHFLLNGVAPGRYLLTLAHARVDSLGLVAPQTEVVVSFARAATATLAISTWRSVVTGLCPESASDTTAAVLRGTVRNAAGHARPGAAVEVSWLRFETATGNTTTLTSRPMRIVTRANENGGYKICGVPGNHPLQITARDAAQTLALVEARIPTGRVGVVDLGPSR